MSLLKPVGSTATRISVAGTTTTVFGGTGFIGPTVVSRIGHLGGQVILPYRGDFTSVRRHRVMGALGQIIPQPFKIFDEDSVRQQMEHCNTVINMIGSWRSTTNYSVEAANEFTAYRVAKIAKEMGVERFIHFSALGATEDSPARFLRSKARSEDIVRTFYPDATILRPGPVWGKGSPWIQRQLRQMRANKRYRYTPIHDPWVQCQPVHEDDVVDAVLHCLVLPESVGNTYELFSDRISMENAYKFLIRRMRAREDAEDKFRFLHLDHKRLLRLSESRSFIDLTLTDRVASGEPGVKTLQDLYIDPIPTKKILSDLIYRSVRGPDAPMLSLDLNEGPRKELQNAYRRLQQVVVQHGDV